MWWLTIVLTLVINFKLALGNDIFWGVEDVFIKKSNGNYYFEIVYKDKSAQSPPDIQLSANCKFTIDKDSQFYKAESFTWTGTVGGPWPQWKVDQQTSATLHKYGVQSALQEALRNHKVITLENGANTDTINPNEEQAAEKAQKSYYNLADDNGMWKENNLIMRSYLDGYYAGWRAMNRRHDRRSKSKNRLIVY